MFIRPQLEPIIRTWRGWDAAANHWLRQNPEWSKT
jgi:hypothetical protein